MTMYRVYHSHWFRTALVVLLIMVLVWFFGALVGFGTMHPLETEIARIITIGVLFLLWLVSNLLQDLNSHRKDKALAAGIAEASPEAKAAEAKTKETERASAEEVALLTERLGKAMVALRKSKLGSSRKRLSAMPWYMIIGPPGAGKTTALQNCGLRFPLDNAKPIAGVGGTRNCEWMFTDEAVLIDTAGRYTTQDSAEEVDSAGWLGFLKLLKKHRRRQPLNGVLIAISLSDLATQPDADRQAHSRAIRQRVRELYDNLGIRLPVYVLFTKADLIAGFSEFFDNFGKEEREQVWGMTLPMDNTDDEEGAVAGFRPEFDLLLNRLNDRMLERVHQESDIRRRRLIYGFPQQVASLRDVAADFLADAFRPSRLEARPLLRGVYFTSGTQDGTPIDRLLGTMASEFGLPRQAVAAPGGPGRSYFLSRLLRDVVFGEAALAGLDPKVERRNRFISIGAYAACGLVLLLLAGSWFASYIGNIELISQVHAGATTYTAQIAELQRRGPADQDLAATIPALDTLRNIRGGYNERDHGTPITLTFGLYQGSKLSRAAEDAYVNALDRILLPRLLSRVEAQLAARMNNVDFLYQTLKVYLVLGRQGPLDKELVAQWVDADLLAAYPGEEGTATRDALAGHVAAMLDQPLPALPLNTALVAQARAVLNKEPLAEYSYNRLLRSKRVVALPEWTVADNGGPGTGRVFQLRSGKGLDTGVAGIYSWPGYHSVFLPLLTTVTQDITEDGWVLGREKRDLQATIRDTNRLRRDVMGLYFDDYVRKWDAVIADISIKPYTNIQQALDQLSLLSAPASPLRDLMLAIDAQTQLSRPAATDAALAASQARAAKIGQRAAGFAALEARSGLTIRQNEVAGILSDALGNDPSGKPIDPAKRVDDHFRALHEFVVGSENKPAGLETAIQGLLAMYQSFNQAANAPGQGQGQNLLSTLGGGATGPGAAARLQDLTRNMPPEVANMLSPVARNATQVAATGASQEMSDAWKSQIVPLCEAAFNRYPFIAGSTDDVPIDDFTQLLGPGGKMEAFFNQYLKPFADTTNKPWKWAATDRIPLGLSPASLAEFERAAQIRDGLFNNGTAIQVRFQLTPLSLDPAVGQISLDIGGQTLTYAHGPTEAQAFVWPGPNNKNGVRVTMTPAAGGNAMVLEKDGPWALLRLLDGHIAGGSQPDKFRVSFTGGGGVAVFDLNASSVRNPFTLSALRSFRCPAKL
jgi:type VI secretion system protein ImpL